MMTEEQYCQLLRNRRRPVARMLFESTTETRLLQRASRSLRARERVNETLEDILPAEWLRRLRVEGLERGTLTIAVSDTEIHELLRRRVPKLLKELGTRVPGLRRVVIPLS